MLEYKYDKNTRATATIAGAVGILMMASLLGIPTDDMNINSTNNINKLHSGITQETDLIMSSTPYLADKLDYSIEILKRDRFNCPTDFRIFWSWKNKSVQKIIEDSAKLSENSAINYLDGFTKVKKNLTEKTNKKSYLFGRKPDKQMINDIKEFQKALPIKKTKGVICEDSINVSKNSGHFDVSFGGCMIGESIRLGFGTVTFTLSSPDEGLYTNNNTPTFTFTPLSTVSTTFTCELRINGTGYGVNATTQNNTATTIVANASLSDGGYYWDINCTDTDGMFHSTDRNFTIDTVLPKLVFGGQTPADNAYVNYNNISINFSVSDTSNTSTFLDFDRSLIGYWSFDATESNGTIWDNSSWGNHGILKNHATNLSVNGKFGQAMEFDGVDDYVSIPHSESINIIDAITIEAYINRESTGTWQRIVGKGGSNGYHVGLNSDDKLHFTIRNIVGIISTGDQLTDTSNWHHLVYVRSGNGGNWTYTFYIDGVLNSAVTDSHNMSGNLGILAIGRGGSLASSYFNGTIDEVRIYSRALSPEEINASYRGSKYYHNFTNLSEGEYNYTAYAMDLAGNLNKSERTVTVDTLPPSCTCTKTPTELNLSYLGAFINTTCNCSDATSEVDNSTFIYGHGLGHNLNVNWSIRYGFGDENRRACNRYNISENPLLAKWYESIGLGYLSDIFTYGVHDTNSSHLSLNGSGDGWSQFRISSLLEHYLHNEWDVCRTCLQYDEKLNNVTVYKKNILAKRFDYGSDDPNTTVVCHVNVHYQGSLSNIRVDYCDSNLVTLNEKTPWDKSYCNLITEFANLTPIYSVRNSTYINEIIFTVDNNSYFGTVRANKTYYILFSAYTENLPGNAYQFPWSNESNISGDGIGFNNINRTFYSTDEGDTWEVQPYTIDMTCRHVHTNHDILREWVYVCDIAGNCNYTGLTNYTMGDIENIAPQINILTPSTGENITRNYSITWNAVDPNGDSMNYTGYLLNSDNSINLTLFTEISDKNYTWDTSNAADGTWSINVTVTDTGRLNDSDTILNFTVDNTNPAITLISPANGSVSSSDIITFSMNVSDNLMLNYTEFWLDFPVWAKNQTNYTQGDGIRNFIINFSEITTDYTIQWHGRVYDTVTRTTTSANWSVTVTTIPEYCKYIYNCLYGGNCTGWWISDLCTQPEDSPGWIW